MIRFFPADIPVKNFFSLSKGYSNWDSLNNEYQSVDTRFVRGWNRALVDFAGGLTCADSHAAIAARYQSLPGVRSVYLDNLNECRFTYQIVIAFDKKAMHPGTVRQYQHWNTLNHIYGVVNVNLAHADALRAILEFEPGLYAHHQMRAIRDEYLKLPGIKFGWVTGKKARQISTIILNFSRGYLRRVPLRHYDFWDGLNRKYATNVTILDTGRARAYIRFPEGKYSDLELKAILRKYRQLPGITSVRMDVEYGPNTASDLVWTNSSYLILPPRRSLASWIHMSLGNRPASHRGSVLEIDKSTKVGGNNNMDNSLNPYGPAASPTAGWSDIQCVNGH